MIHNVPLKRNSSLEDFWSQDEIDFKEVFIFFILGYQR